MKKFMCLLLIFVFLLGAVGCTSETPPPETTNDGNTSLPPEETGDPTNESPNEPSDSPADAPADSPSADDPTPNKNLWLTWERLNAIPVATDDMTTDELRQICLAYMRLQLTFQWSPSATLHYKINSMSKEVNFYKGEIYAGLPYDSPSHYGSLYTALDYFDTKTGILDVSDMNGDTLASIVGNHCSGACLWAWGRVSNSMRYSDAANSTQHYATLTNHLTVPHGFLPVGPYEASATTVDWSDNEGTSLVCNANGEQVMYESYAAMLPADGVVTNYLKSNGKRTGHCKMIEAVPVVVRDGKGKIVGDLSYVMICEQADEYREETLPDGTTAIYQGAVMRKTTFKELWRDKYVPFTLAEFQGKNPVEKGFATLMNTTGGGAVTLSTLTSANLVANYAIAKADITVTDADGEVLYTHSKMPSAMQTFSMSMGSIVGSLRVEDLQAGHTITVGVRISTGEYVEAFRYTVSE